jgi:hypothetical protein
MRRLALVSVLAGVVVCCGCQSGETVRLFNGKSLKGWTVYPADANETWSVKEGLLCATGQPNGYVRTVEGYGDYHLHVEWRWAAEPGNSGVLLHMQGEDEVWPQTIECQLAAGSAGDFWLIGDVQVTVEGERYDGSEGPVNVPKMEESSEKAAGEWNRYDIFCRDDTIKCLVNGVVQNAGRDLSVSEGKICLQSEGAPIEFRNILLERLP